MWRRYKRFASRFTFTSNRPPAPNLHHACVDVDLIARLIELTDTHDVGPQSRNEVDPIKRLGLAVLPHEHDSLMALNPHHQVITEMNDVEHPHTCSSS
jgi:hypothetical protein